MAIIVKIKKLVRNSKALYRGKFLKTGGLTPILRFLLRNVYILRNLGALHTINLLHHAECLKN